jgi:hypothetical protein
VLNHPVSRGTMRRTGGHETLLSFDFGDRALCVYAGQI